LIRIAIKMPNLIDTHAHLDHVENIEEVSQEARGADFARWAKSAPKPLKNVHIMP